MTDIPDDRATWQRWRESLRAFRHPRVVTMLFLGFSAGIPLLLIFSSLSLWLREAGVERSAVTFFSWAALGYSFKFIWAPLVDQLPLPWLTRWLGRRRAWMLLAQSAIIAAIAGMASIDPASGTHPLTLMAMAAVLLGFASATQDIVVDAYRIESAESSLQAMMSSSYIAGYRVGMLVAGAGALFLASALGSTAAAYDYAAWRASYLIMALCMLVGVCTTLLISEPVSYRHALGHHSNRDYAGFMLTFVAAVAAFVTCFAATGGPAASAVPVLAGMLGTTPPAQFLVGALRLALALCGAGLTAALLVRAGLVNAAMLRETYLAPVQEFFERYGLKTSVLLLTLVGVYRVSDILLGVIANVFYQDMGFSKVEIATVVKTFGLVMTIAGGFLGGLLSVRYGVLRILFLGALLSAATNLLFLALASMHSVLWMLYVVISADNLSAGLAGAAFIAFLSSLTNIQFTAMQYAIFSSLMTLFPKILGGYAGTLVDSMGYPGFFVLTALLGVPVLLLVWRAGALLFGEPEVTADAVRAGTSRKPAA